MLPLLNLFQKEKSLLRKLILLTKGVKVLEITVVTRFSVSPDLVIQEWITVDSLDPCAQKFVLSHENLFTLKLKLHSNVLREWAVEDVIYTGDCYHVKLKFHGCSCKTTFSFSKVTYGGTRRNFEIDGSGIFLIPHWAVKLTEQSYHHIRGTTLRPTGAYKKSQTLIQTTEVFTIRGNWRKGQTTRISWLTCKH